MNVIIPWLNMFCQILAICCGMFNIPLVVIILIYFAKFCESKFKQMYVFVFVIGMGIYFIIIPSVIFFTVDYFIDYGWLAGLIQLAFFGINVLIGRILAEVGNDVIE